MHLFTKVSRLHPRLKIQHTKRPYVLGSKLPLFSHGRDGQQPYSRVLYTNYKDSLLKVG